jgi:Domain of unknown function (DUF397)
MATDAARSADTQWRKSSFCATGECVEVTRQDGMLVIRDSKHPMAGTQRYTQQEWRAFVLGIKAGEFDDLG